MTDKVQKIKEWISKTQDVLMNAKGNFDNPSCEGAFHILSSLDYYINSLQKEPVGEKKCMFTKDSYTDEDRKVLCKDCDEKCEYSKKEESVSEDLEHELVQWWNNHYAGIDKSYTFEKIVGHYIENSTLLEIAHHFADWQKNHQEPISEDLEKAAVEWFNSVKYKSDLSAIPINAFKAGAKWQEEQDQETIELAEDHAMLAGMEKMKEEMMAKAVVACVTDMRIYKREIEVDFTVMYEKGVIPYEIEQEVKVIVIKEE